LLKKTIDLILKEKRPDISGASGSLEFDSEYGIDPIKTFYNHWTIKDQKFEITQTISSGEVMGGELEKGSSVLLSKASEKHASLLNIDHSTYIPEQRKELWAVIISATKDWKNYRHQSDALAMYQLLKDNGVQDEKIILMLVDDITLHEKNPLPGVVRHIPEGTNIREGVEIDYLKEEVTVDNFIKIIKGEKNEKTPIVLNSDKHSNVLIFMVGHGLPGMIPFDYGGGLTSDKFKEIIEEMYQEEKYRRMFIMVEVCFGESMAMDLKTPGVVYFTGSALNEQSFGSNYDDQIKTWLADDFTHKTIMTISKNQNIYLSDLYTNVYQRVSGSHVKLKNCENFGNPDAIRIREFVTP
jgi:glycosylphosphatidylinositol transamidase (GPIT) subunit GPI8